MGATMADSEDSTAVRGPLMLRLTLNPATLVMEAMAVMAALELATMAGSGDSTAARGPLMPTLTLNPASMVDTEAMAVMAASAGATMVASEDSTADRFMTLFEQRPST